MSAGGRGLTLANRKVRSEGNPKQYADGAFERYARTQALAWASASGPVAAVTK